MAERNEVSAILGKGAHFEGKLRFEGTVRIEGRFTGDIDSEGELVVGEGARVQAELNVGRLVAQGDIVGDVKAAESVTLRAPARLKGHITSPALVMDQGVIFDGNVTMTPRPASANAPQASAPAASAPAPAVPAQTPPAAPAAAPSAAAPAIRSTSPIAPDIKPF